MSKQEQLILATVDAWNRGDLAAWLATVCPDAELHTVRAFPDFEPVYRGHEGLAEFWRNIHEPWQTLRVELERVIDGDDYVVAEYRFRGEGGGSGVQADARFFNAVRVRDGLVTKGLRSPELGEGARRAGR